MIPRFVALCGAPGSGKTTIAELLAYRYDAVIVDDGLPLREACFALYGGQRSDFNTQHGKAERRMVCGRSFTHRELLGDLGTLLEEFYGEQFMPERAIASCLGRSAPFFLFPSCRKTQGLTYRQQGGLVIEVVRPGSVSVHAFDRYDPRYVTHRIVNNGSLDDLERQVVRLFEQMAGGA